MENKFTYPNTPIKIKFSKIFAINALNIKCLINHFLLLLWLHIELDVWLGLVNVYYVEPRLIYEFIALFDGYYINPSSTSIEIICVALT
jgi:hypothetical protein